MFLALIIPTCINFVQYMCEVCMRKCSNFSFAKVPLCTYCPHLDRCEMDEDKAKKEAALEEKMRHIRKKNEERLRRLQEIEEDRANADLYSDQVAQKSPRNKMAGVQKERPPPTQGFQRGRGKLLTKMSRESLKAAELEEKKRQNIKREDEELRRSSAGQSSASGFLVDDKRMDMGKATRRSPHSYGGSHFGSAVSRMSKERSHVKHWGQDPEVCMTGKERLEYSEWKKERKKIDTDRRERQKKGEHWSREWDQTKEWDRKKGMWHDAHSGKPRRNKKPETSYAEDSWGEDTSEKVWDAKNRRWVDPKEAVSFEVTEEHEEDWSIEVDQQENPTQERESKKKYSSSSEGSGDGRGCKHQQDYTKVHQSANTCADDLTHKVTVPKETPSSISEDTKDILKMGSSDVGESPAVEGVKVVDQPAADPKPQRIKVNRKRGSAGKNAQNEDKDQQLEEEGAALQEQAEKDQRLLEDQTPGSAVADVPVCPDQNVQDRENEDRGEKENEKGSHNNTALLEERQEDELKPSEKRKESFDFVPYSPLEKLDLPLEWGDLEIDEDQLDTAEIKMVTQ